MADYEVENKTVTLTVPTQGSVPVISISGWIIWMHRYVPSGFNWNVTRNDYRDGFGDSDSDDFWLGLRYCSWDGGLLAGSGESSPSDDVRQLPTALGMAREFDQLLVLD